MCSRTRCRTISARVFAFPPASMPIAYGNVGIGGWAWVFCCLVPLSSLLFFVIYYYQLAPFWSFECLSEQLHATSWRVNPRFVVFHEKVAESRVVLQPVPRKYEERTGRATSGDVVKGLSVDGYHCFFSLGL